jgi:hypothetical protein
MKLCGTQYQEIEIMLTSAKARSTVWDVTELSGWLSASVTSFMNRPRCIACTTVVTIMNDSGQNPYIIEVWKKKTYHVVLKWPMHWLYGAQLCHFIILIDNVIIAIGVR